MESLMGFYLTEGAGRHFC